MAYAKDGLPRWISTVPLPSDPVFTASEVGKAFIEELEVWRDLPPVTDRRVYQKLSEYDDVDFENNSDLDKNNAQRKKKRDVARTSPDWSQESELPTLKERKERPRKRRRYFTDDRAKSRVLKSDNTRRKSFWGLNTGMGSWQYQIEGLSEAFVNNVGASAYPSVGAELSWWFSPMVGLDIKMQGSILGVNSMRIQAFLFYQLNFHRITSRRRPRCKSYCGKVRGRTLLSLLYVAGIFCLRPLQNHKL